MDFRESQIISLIYDYLKARVTRYSGCDKALNAIIDIMEIYKIPFPGPKMRPPVTLRAIVFKHLDIQQWIGAGVQNIEHFGVIQDTLANIAALSEIVSHKPLTTPESNNNNISSQKHVGQPSFVTHPPETNIKPIKKKKRFGSTRLNELSHRKQPPDSRFTIYKPDDFGRQNNEQERYHAYNRQYNTENNKQNNNNTNYYPSKPSLTTPQQHVPPPQHMPQQHVQQQHVPPPPHPYNTSKPIKHQQISYPKPNRNHQQNKSHHKIGKQHQQNKYHHRDGKQYQQHIYHHRDGKQPIQQNIRFHKDGKQSQQQNIHHYKDAEQIRRSHNPTPGHNHDEDHDDDVDEEEEEEEPMMETILDSIMEEESVNPNEQSLIMDNIKSAIDDDFIAKMVNMINQAKPERKEVEDTDSIFDPQAIDGIVTRAGDIIMDKLIQHGDSRSNGSVNPVQQPGARKHGDTNSNGKHRRTPRTFSEYKKTDYQGEEDIEEVNLKKSKLNPKNVVPMDFSQIVLPSTNKKSPQEAVVQPNLPPTLP